MIEQPENDLEISLLRIVKDKLNDTRSDNAKEQKNLNACESSSNKRNCRTKYSFGGKSHDRKKKCLAFRVKTVNIERQT